MGNVILDVSMSLDGFITGPNDDADNPLGLGGHRLVQWVFGDRTEAEDRLVEGSEGGCGRDAPDARSVHVDPEIGEPSPR